MAAQRWRLPNRSVLRASSEVVPRMGCVEETGWGTRLQELT